MKDLKYRQIVNYYKDKIKNNEISQGDKIATEAELQSKFDVSRHTVRRALEVLEKENYIYKEKSVGCFVKKSEGFQENIVVVITTHVSDYIFPYIIRGIQDVLSKNGFDIMLLSTNNDKDKEAMQLEKLLSYNIKGAIIEPTNSAKDNINKKYYDELFKRNIPFVTINSYYENYNNPYVIMKDKKGGYIATKHLLELGHKNVAGIFKEDDMQGVMRKDGYLEALEEFNINIDKSLIGSYKSSDEDFYPYAFVKNLLKNNKELTGIVCYNDKIAMQVILALKELEKKVPEDVSIVGYDNKWSYINGMEDGITSVEHPKEDLGIKAGEILLDMMENNSRNNSPYKFEPKLIIKNSTKKI
ncbi:MAG: GntR family transcriptional regulator [Lachnospirales bacterium]